MSDKQTRQRNSVEWQKFCKSLIKILEMKIKISQIKMYWKVFTNQMDQVEARVSVWKQGRGV